MTADNASPGRLRPWAAHRTRPPGPGVSHHRRLRRARLVTVCEEARCPNLGECFARRTASFMLLGDRCTRRCAFCSVATGRPAPVDSGEAGRVAAAAKALDLRYVVLTSVARDDLSDEGADGFAAAVRALRRELPQASVEVLTPDFSGRAELVGRVVDAGPDVFGHNLETVERLSRQVRGRAGYARSLEVLSIAAELKAAGAGVLVKSGLMVGLGESRDEIRETMKDIRQAGADLLTVGQYLRPTRGQIPVARYLEPAEFEEISAEARALGFEEVAAGPLVRSSYRADELYRRWEAAS